MAPKIAKIAESIQEHYPDYSVTIYDLEYASGRIFKSLEVKDSTGHVVISHDSTRDKTIDLLKEVHAYFGPVWEAGFEPLNQEKRKTLISKLKKNNFEKVFDCGFLKRTRSNIEFFHLLFDSVEVGILNRSTDKYEEKKMSYDAVLKAV